jgi:transcriptional regulator with XRE-family HTH domain
MEVTMTVGPLLREWRVQRRMSQAALSDAAEVSTRHLSCLETGKAHPSQQMVLLLASALDVPLRERNTMLRAAGYAPAYPESDLFADSGTAVRHAVELIVHSAPFGAVAVDRLWTVVLQDSAFDAFRRSVFPRPMEVGDNLLERTFAADGLRPFIENWEEVARTTLERVRREALADSDDELWALYESLLGMQGVPSEWRQPATFLADRLVIPVVLRVGDQRASLFSTLTTVGTPVDVTLSELRIESYYPADAQTEALLRAVRDG